MPGVAGTVCDVSGLVTRLRVAKGQRVNKKDCGKGRFWKTEAKMPGYLAVR